MKRRLIIPLILSIFTIFSLNAQLTLLEQKLYELPDVIFEKIETPEGYQEAYNLLVRQPLDHEYPSKGYFYQRVYLSHKGFERPTVMITEGYSRGRNGIYELTGLLGANQVMVEHRYFGGSIPDSLDYNYLNLEQATADLHYINQLMRMLYSGKWISTGISKGGQTTIYYRYFYPEDVDVSVPYVAPLNLSLEDERIYHFLDTVGTKECRDAIYNVQKRMLENREEILPMLEYYVMGADLTFTYLTFEQAFEYAVLEYPFSFWQWGADCEEIPDGSADLKKLVKHFQAVSGMDFFSDQSMEAYASHYYQAASQMGYYGYEIDGLKGLIQALPTSHNPLAIFVPGKMEVPFNDALAKKVHEWVKTEGNNFIYIYGNSDTWSATAVMPSDEVNSKWFFLEGKDHGAARIGNMTTEQKAELKSTLEKWLEIELE
ncbi:MAG: S28 family serine protease [Cyclobacteriaceae bacterium]